VSTSDRIERFAHGRRCPVCGGGDGDRRGQGTRCHGFASGEWVHCSREEHAGKARYEPESRTYLHRASGPCPCGVEHAPGADPRAPIEHVYRYRNAEGRVVLEVVRLRGKQFRQRRPLDNGEYAWNLGGVEPILYNLPALLAADAEEVVWICEGEKDADRLGALGLLATCNPMGAGKWRDSHGATLEGRHCQVLADNDDVGRAHALAVARSLHGRAASVRIVELPGLPPKGDVSDWLDAGGDRERLCEIGSETPEWEPTGEPAPAPAPTGGGGGGNGNGNGRIDFSAMSEAELGLIPLETVTSANVDWLWQYRLARGEMALVAGEGGLGKSMFLMACAAAVSIGGPWPAGLGTAPRGTVVIVSAEDNPRTTIRPRLEAMGADIRKVKICKARVTIDQDGVKSVHPMSLQDHSYWKAIFDFYGDVALFIVDPIPSYLGRGVNDRQNAEIRAVLEPFIEDVIRPRGICFYANTHLSKAPDARSPIQRITGSIAYANIPRNVHLIVRDPDDPDRRFWKQAKCNNGPDNLPALAYRIKRRDVPGEGGELVEAAVALFEEALHQIDLAEVMNGEKGRRGPQPVKSSRFARWLWDQLAAGQAVPVRDLVDGAREAGLMPAPTDRQPKPSITPLYRARDRMLADHPGFDVIEAAVPIGIGREAKAWRLQAAQDAPDEDEDEDEGPPEGPF
jgi:hypothetical protein